MKIETSGVIEELAAMPRRAAVEYCRERIEECSRAIDVAEGRAHPERPRIVLAHAMPLPPRSRT